MLFFSQNNKTKMLKRNKIYFFSFLGPTRIDLGPTYSH